MPALFRHIFIYLLLIPFAGFSQIHIDGKVLDVSKKNLVEGVRVVSTNGMFDVTDSLGKFSISVGEHDSLTFYYNNKPTQQFAVSMIPDPSNFSISIHVPVKSKYQLLSDVIVYAKSHKQDSLENRMDYAKEFNYHKPGLSTSVVPGGGAGADVNEIINIFRFKRNKRLKAFQERLEAQEQEKYVNYRFSKITVQRITGLKGQYLDTFLVWYRPSYEFAHLADEISFNQYVLDAFYQFRRIVNIPEGKKEEGGG